VDSGPGSRHALSVLVPAGSYGELASATLRGGRLSLDDFPVEWSHSTSMEIVTDQESGAVDPMQSDHNPI